MSEYRPHYKWRLTWPEERENDFVGYDGDEYIGRIYLTRLPPPLGDRWQWFGDHPLKSVKEITMAHTGYVVTAREASRMVEEFWDKMKA